MTAPRAQEWWADGLRRPRRPRLAHQGASTRWQAEWIVVLLLLPMVAAADDAAKDVKSWLDRISQASQQHSYQGTFVYRCQSQLTAMRVVHAASSDGPVERLTSLNGPAHEITQSAAGVTAVVASNQPHVVTGRRAGSLVGKPLSPEAVLASVYEVSEAGGDRVAGRNTRLVSIAPRDRYRHGFHLWLDAETGVVLRSDMYNSVGEPIEQVMFTDIEYISLDEAMAAMDAGALATAAAPQDTSAQVSATAPRSQWSVERAPDGFALAEHYTDAGDGGHAGNEQLVYSDGLASVSVFIEAKDGQRPPFLGSAQVGAVAAYGRIVDDYQVTVVGEVPGATVEMIGESLHLQKAQ